MLTRELEAVKEQNEDKVIFTYTRQKILDQIANLEDSNKRVDQDSLQINIDIKNMEKLQKSNEKKIESIQSDRDDALKINRLTQDVFQLKQKIKAFSEKRAVFNQLYM